jgi:hypothetical protein
VRRQVRYPLEQLGIARNASRKVFIERRAASRLDVGEPPVDRGYRLDVPI